MAPPLSTALMQSRPLLDPSPHTIVAPLILSNPLFHKCRISDHLHLVFQWGIHTDLLSKREVALFTNVYTPPAQARMLRKHEGHPARAPDGTIMEIQGDACPGNTGESVGPWDFGNVHMCEGYAEWSSGLSQTLNMAIAAGLKIEEVNMPQPSREELEKAQETSSQWLHGRPLHPSTRKSLTAHRDGIRDKLDAFLAFVDVQIKSETGKEAVFTTLREALGAALAGNEVGEYNGVLGGMVNKITDRIEDFIEYMEERIEVSEAKQQRIDEVREIIDTALKGKQKRKRDDEDEGNDQARKKIMTADAKIKTEEDLTTELAEPPKPRKRDRKAKIPSLRKREPKKTKDEDSALEMMKGKNKQNGGDKLSTEEEAATENYVGTKDKAEKSDTYEKGAENSKSECSSETTASSTSAAKEKEVEAEANSSRRRSSATSSRNAPAGSQRPGTPPPPYSQHDSPSPMSSRTQEQTARRTSVPEQIPQSATPAPESRSITPASTSSESAVRKYMTPAAQILEKIRNTGKRRSEDPTKENSRSSTSSTSTTSSPSPSTDRTIDTIQNTDPANAKTPPALQSPDTTSHTGPKEHAEDEDEEEEDSLFLLLKESETPSKESQHHDPEAADPETPAATAEEKEDDDDDGDFLFNRPNTPHRQSSYDLELPPPPSKARKQTPEVAADDESSLFLPQTQTPPPPPVSAQVQTRRQSSYDLDLPPPPKARLGSSKMPIDIDIDLSTSPSPSSSPTSRQTRERTSIFGGSSVKIKFETSSSNYIEIKDEDDEDDDLDIEIEGAKAVKEEVLGSGQKGVGVKKESDDDGEVMMCSRDEWVKEVKKKNESAIQGQARPGRGRW
ncbi:hypothetical protein DL98DRAFT_540830 [Cadophora sp. DSE1049]|nr:hypothetical protein DL98DRAFT_540830 [Cadophora sp. DSE1049]